VRSDIYFEQMKGRGVRSIPRDDLLQVTPDAGAGKDRFVIIDAVGVTESRKTATQPLERCHSVKFDKLIEHVAAGDRRDDTLITLATRLTTLDAKLEDTDRERVRALAGGSDLHAIAATLYDAADADANERAAVEEHGPSPTEKQIAAVERRRKDAAAKPFDNPALRQLLKDLKTKSEIVIDEISTDAVIGAEFDVSKAQATTGRFRDFIEQNKDGLTALQILYGRPASARKLTYAALQELAEKLLAPPWVLDTAHVWQAYRRLDAAKVRGAPMEKVLTELVALVRYAIGQTEVLESFAVGVEQRFNLWIGRQKKAGREFSEEQLRWLQLIKRYVAQNAEVTPRDLLESPTFTHEGGLGKARAVFGRDQLQPMLDDLAEALVA